jgi:hypothetical protein
MVDLDRSVADDLEQLLVVPDIIFARGRKSPRVFRQGL